jgi:tetratricopeptide (TPR) repeat protein
VTFGLCTALWGASGCAGRSDALRPLPATDPMRAVQARQMMEEGLSLARAGDLVRAEQYLAEALDRGADPHAVLPTLLRVCVSASRFRAAVTYAARYLERNPGDWPLRFLVGTIHEELGEHFTARRHFEAVLSQREAHAGAHFMLGKILRDTYANPTEADVHFRRYLELEPRGPFADEARGSLLRMVVPTGDADIARPPTLRSVEPTPEPAAPATPAANASPATPATPAANAAPPAPTPTAPAVAPRAPSASPTPRQVPR